jgi:hypothetical protein
MDNGRFSMFSTRTPSRQPAGLNVTSRQWGHKSQLSSRSYADKNYSLLDEIKIKRRKEIA